MLGFLTKKEKAQIFAIPQLIITDKGIISIEKLKKGMKIVGANNVVNTVDKVEKNIKKGDYFYLINKDLFVYKDQSLMIDGNAIHAFEVKKGDFLDRKDGTRERIVSIKKIKGDYYFHRLEVSGDHTYFINEILVHNANRFWVGGNGTWNATSTGKWSTTSGGSPGSAVPTASDAVFLDNGTGHGNVTISGSRTCLSLDCTNYVGTLNLGTGGTDFLTIATSVTFVAGMTLTFSAASITDTLLTLGTSTSGTILTGGKIMPPVSIASGGATMTFGDNYTSAGFINFLRGTLNGNGKNITIAAFNAAAQTASVLNMGSGTWEMTGTVGISGGPVWTLNPSGGTLTINANTSTLKFTNTSNTNIATQTSPDMAYNNIWFSRGASTGGITLDNISSCADIKDDGTGTHTITIGQSFTATSWHISGTAGHLITVTRGSTWTLTIASGTINANYLNLVNSHATGGATFYAGANSTDGGGNTGWLFASPPLTFVKNVMGLATASVKTVDNLAIASVKTIDDL